MGCNRVRSRPLHATGSAQRFTAIKGRGSIRGSGVWDIAKKDPPTPVQALTFRVQTFQEHSASSIKGDNSSIPVMRWVGRAPNLSY